MEPVMQAVRLIPQTPAKCAILQSAKTVGLPKMREQIVTMAMRALPVRSATLAEPAEAALHKFATIIISARPTVAIRQRESVLLPTIQPNKGYLVKVTITRAPPTNAVLRPIVPPTPITAIMRPG